MMSTFDKQSAIFELKEAIDDLEVSLLSIDDQRLRNEITKVQLSILKVVNYLKSKTNGICEHSGVELDGI